MLGAIGRSELDTLFDAIPEKLRLRADMRLPAAASEQEVTAEFGALAARNEHAGQQDWFLGAGTYAHFVPSAVDALVSRSEFTTSYTPYQPEFSQGTLQAIFEWQTMMASLTGCDVSNASMYDGASATAEAALMAMRITRRSKVVVASGVHPTTRQVVGTYLEGLDAALHEWPRAADGRSSDPQAVVDDDTACLILQQPSFFGTIEDVAAAAEAAHAHGALLVVAVGEALSLALLEAPGRLGADIVCGEAQSFGVPMAFGGPHLGFLATMQPSVRQMPGRLVGETVDSDGKRGFVLTLSTREQHIRRDRATSNICTNQGLCLMMATVYLTLLGKQGLVELARMNLAKAEYLKARVRAHPRLSLPYDAPTFNEFVVGTDDAGAALARARDAGIVAGLDLGAAAPEIGPALLVCTTELCTRDAIDRWVDVVGGAA